MSRSARSDYCSSIELPENDPNSLYEWETDRNIAVIVLSNNHTTVDALRQEVISRGVDW